MNMTEMKQVDKFQLSVEEKKKYMWNEAVFKENKMLRMKVLAKKAFQDSGVR